MMGSLLVGGMAIGYSIIGRLDTGRVWRNTVSASIRVVGRIRRMKPPDSTR